MAFEEAKHYVHTWAQQHHWHQDIANETIVDDMCRKINQVWNVVSHPVSRVPSDEWDIEDGYVPVCMYADTNEQWGDAPGTGSPFSIVLYAGVHRECPLEERWMTVSFYCGIRSQRFSTWQEALGRTFADAVKGTPEPQWSAIRPSGQVKFDPLLDIAVRRWHSESGRYGRGLLSSFAWQQEQLDLVKVKRVSL